jgi:cytochrome oxidase Cu insertion factor (SCO1/SenC/PrrC family)
VLLYLRNRLRPVLAAALLAPLIAVSPLLPAAVAQAGKIAPSSAAAGSDKLPNIAMTDQHGRAVSLQSLRGKPVLVAFIHTQCEGPCELITSRMKQVAQALGTNFSSEVTMLSVTTEPDEDGPRELLAYARARGVNTKGWVFLTGAPSKVHRLLAAYGVLAEENRSDHVIEVFLIAPGGRQVSAYNGVTTPPDKIAADISKIASLR